MNKEIGSFLELDLRKKKEFYQEDENIARLNSGRSGIFHSINLLNCSKIYLPFYLCSSVRDFLIKKNIKIEYYRIDKHFAPQIDKQVDNSAILIVNYFGLVKFNTHVISITL